MFSLFAAESGPTIHVAPGGVTHIAGFTVTNSILYGWVSSLIIIALLVLVARRITVKPKGGAIQFVEVAADFISNAVESAFEDRSRGRKYVPFFVTIFFFVLLTNWLGLLPGVGEAFTIGETPLLRPLTGDLAGTLAIGIFTMGFVYVASVRESGGFGNYLRHFFVGNPLNPLYLVIGILEIVSDILRVFSLSLRLFLNVTIGEIVIAVFSYLGSYAAPVSALPFTMIELFVGALQAYIFTVLSLMYLAITVNHASEHAAGHDTDLTHDEVPETISLTPSGVKG